VLIPPKPVAPVVEPEEDEWEWEIALARARVAAEEAEAAVRLAAPPVPRRTRQDTVPPPPVSGPKTAPMPVMAMRDPIDSGEWPKTEPLGNIDYEDYTNPTAEVVRVIRLANVRRTTLPAAPAPKATPPSQPVVRATPRAQSPTTIIPVPRLPRITDTHSAFEPVVSPPRRAAKGTPPPPVPADKPIGVAPPPPIRSGDETKPGIALPPPATVVTLPRIPGLKRPAPRG
jgi:hypothetical protein